MVVAAPTEEQVDRLFHALADATRRDILRRCAVGAVQKHVSVLQRAGLVTKERRGREQLVRTDAAAVRRARDVLEQLEVTWRQRVDRMSDVLEEMREPDGRHRR